MRIGLVLPKVPGYSETFFRSKVKGLTQNGHEVFIFVNKGNNHAFTGAKVRRSYVVNRNDILSLLLITGVFIRLIITQPKRIVRFYKLLKADGKSIFSILRNFCLNAHILKQDLDWLHFGFATMVFEREYLAKAIGAKMAISIRGFDIAIYPVKNPGCYNGVWPMVDWMHVISEDLRDKLLALDFPEDKPIVKITPAIDFNKFYADRAFHSNHKPVKILSVGRLHWKKGFEYGLGAMAYLKSERIDFKYTIIGAGEELERLKFAAYQLGVEDRVEFLGAKTADEVAGFMKQADVYFQPSNQEGFCNSVLEAQAAGCLCIVSDAEGLSENVVNEVTGWVVPRRDVVSMGTQLKKVIQLSPSSKFKIIETAQKRVCDTFNIDNQVKEFIRLYENG